MVHFRLFNIPVIIQPSFWVFLLFFCYNGGREPLSMLLLAGIMVLSLLIHECGHAFAALKYGQNPTITLESFGGYVSYPNRGLAEKHRCVISVAGPCFTALLIGISYCVLKSHLFSLYWAQYFFYWMMKLNIYWLIVNLAPILPLDGGQILGYFLKRGFGEERGVWLSLLIGMATAAIGVVYFVFEQSAVFAFLFGFYGVKNFQAFQNLSPKKEPSSPFMQLKEALNLLTTEKPAKAEAIFRKLMGVKDSYIQGQALEGMARSLHQQKRYAQAYELLKAHGGGSTAEAKWLFCNFAYQQKEFFIVTERAYEMYQLRPTFEMALLNAKAFSSMKNTALAEGWIHTALQFEEAKSFNKEELLSDFATPY